MHWKQAWGRMDSWWHVGGCLAFAPVRLKGAEKEKQQRLTRCLVTLTDFCTEDFLQSWCSVRPRCPSTHADRLCSVACEWRVEGSLRCLGGKPPNGEGSCWIVLPVVYAQIQRGCVWGTEYFPVESNSDSSLFDDIASSVANLLARRCWSLNFDGSTML